MPLNSSIKWTVNCNTTCRLLLALALVLLLAVPAGAESARESTSKGDILLLHRENPEAGALESLRVLADTATSLGRRMAIAVWDASSEAPSDYQLVICYDLEADSALGNWLLQGHTKVLFLGGQMLPLCLPDAIALQNSGEKGVLQFSFSGAPENQAIVTLSAPVYHLAGSYQSGTLEIGSSTLAFCTGNRQIRYIPVTDLTGSLARGALMQEISAFFLEDSATAPEGMYLVLDEVYAYTPAQTLFERVEPLIAAKLPFVISVAPTFQNADYPAMGQFCQVLRYAQANGGAVILRVPALREQVSDWAQFRSRMDDAVAALTARGVYPLAYDVPYRWLWDTDAPEWMQQSRTIFLRKDTAAVAFSSSTERNFACGSENRLVFPGLELEGRAENAGGLFCTAQRIPVSVSIETLDSLLERARSGSGVYYSLWNGAQSLQTESQTILCKSGCVTLNGQPQSLAYVPEPCEENHDYQRNVLKRFTVNIQKQSHFLIGLVAVTTVVFVGMILYARAQARKHFFQTGGRRYVPAHARKKSARPVQRPKKHIPAHARKKRRS